ncbi:MAG: hypothetical protein FWD53_05810 [Phycisphaerales bacterium]|nr:hypothetical protein [Phycisphaerales bacterium]
MMAAIKRIATTKIDKSHDAVATVRATLRSDPALRGGGAPHGNARLWRRAWLISGIAAAIAVMAGVWMVSQTHEQHAGSDPASRGGVDAAADTSDEAFRKWAAPYEALKIPMVSREEAGAWREPPIRPMRWESNM